MPNAFDTTVSLLIIDDDLASLRQFSTALQQPGLKIFTASNYTDGLRALTSHHPQVVLTELAMPGIPDLEVLNQVVERDPSIKVIIAAARWSPDSVVEAITRGASDFITKPITAQRLRERVGRWITEAHQRLQAEQAHLSTAPEFDGIVGRSAPMRAMLLRATRIAPHYRSLLISGETGTGKDLIAQAVHKLSPAATGRFVVLNCSAVVETLFESELFGHVKGAFTGANYDKPGLVEHAHLGTLFLDEIGDMPLSTQAKLLRVLQNHEVQRIGSLNARKVDVRIIAATNKDLRALVAEKRFREDLYYRLAMVEIFMPALCARKEDLPLLCRHFVSGFADQYGKDLRGLTPRTQIRLARHTWPGNVRELENVIGHSAMMTDRDMIDVVDLPHYLAVPLEQVETDEVLEIASFEQHECLLLRRALEETAGNQSQAARMLRIGRDALRYKIRKHNLDQRNPETTLAAAG